MTTPSNPLLDDLKHVFHRVKAHFRVSPDEGEHWRMPPPRYDGAQWLSDDCDGFCLACRSLLRQRAIPSRLVYCQVEQLDHLVVEVDGWILDNLQPTVVPNTLLTAQNYRWVRISGYEAGQPWREITGFAG